MPTEPIPCRVSEGGGGRYCPCTGDSLSYGVGRKGKGQSRSLKANTAMAIVLVLGKGGRGLRGKKAGGDFHAFQPCRALSRSGDVVRGWREQSAAA